MSELLIQHPAMMLVRFEQARGRNGVPRAWLIFYTGLDVRTYIRQAVELMRAACADPSGHSRDIMPGYGADAYLLHNIDGGVIEKPDDIRWEQLPGTQQQRAELVLTYGLPADHLVRVESNTVTAT